jgi:hypothetical protein
MRRFQARRPLLAVLAAAVPSGTALFLACTAPSPTVHPLPVREDESGSPYSTTSGYDPGTSGTTTKPPSDDPLPDGGKPPGQVYAHTADTLYLFEPLSKTLTQLGKFGCLDEGDRVLDIALDKTSTMYATSDHGFLKVVPIALAGGTVDCSYIKNDPGAYPNSLGFVPIGTVDPTKEALVGYAFDGPDPTKYVRIDLDGTVTKIGSLNPPDASTHYRSSGDVIGLSRFLNGNRAFLTVSPLDGDAAATDSLAEIDPATGTIKQVFAETGHTTLYGLGQWAGSGYAFAASGEIVQIDIATGNATTVQVTGFDGGVVSWYGAGVTTDAPTAP